MTYVPIREYARTHEYYSLCSLNINGFRRRQTRIISVLCFRIDTDRYNNIIIGVSGVGGIRRRRMYIR
jgi:hypothetical protein